MKKILTFIVLLSTWQLSLGQSVLIEPTHANGSILTKTPNYSYGNLSTTMSDGADLIFRRAEPANGLGEAGTSVGTISTWPDRFQISANGNHYLNFFLNGGNRFRIMPNGYVGLNTTAPSRFLHVNGSTILSETSDSANVQIGSSNILEAKLVVNNSTFQHGVSIISPFNPGGFALNVDGTTRLQGATIIEGAANIQNALTAQQGIFNGSVTVNGNLAVSGSVSKGSGSFKIDHPLDPENKLLYHSFVESPDMMNVYNGNVITDDKGLATIQLPDYFEALNKDFRYQLTPVGAFAQAMVAQKVKNNQFIIQTDKPSIEISWQVTGIRNDAYAQKFRIPNTVEKSTSEKGKYLYPEAFEKK